MRAAVVGLGWWGKVIVKNLAKSDKINVVCGVDQDLSQLKEFGVEYCNITRCCTEVCPAGIQITDDAIIQLKERVVDRYYDPLQRIWRTLTRQKVRY